MKAHVTYLSKTGITRKYASEIEAFLRANQTESIMQNIHDANPSDVSDADLVLLGAWCHGLFIFLQHPDKPWVEFARKLPDLSGKKVALFTTYKLATGSMFRKMKKQLKLAENQQVEIFKSKNGSLSEEDNERLWVWIKS
jgi:flavodoxin